MPIAIATGCQIGMCCNYSGIVNYHNRIYCVAVPVLANFPSGSNCLYVEKVFSTNWTADYVYVPPDSLILKKNPRLHVANFSASAIMVQIGQVLEKGHNPNSWLDHMGKYSLENKQNSRVHTQVI